MGVVRRCVSDLAHRLGDDGDPSEVQCSAVIVARHRMRDRRDCVAVGGPRGGEGACSTGDADDSLCLPCRPSVSLRLASWVRCYGAAFAYL